MVSVAARRLIVAAALLLLVAVDPAAAVRRADLNRVSRPKKSETRSSKKLAKRAEKVEPVKVKTTEERILEFFNSTAWDKLQNASRRSILPMSIMWVVAELLLRIPLEDMTLEELHKSIDESGDGFVDRTEYLNAAEVSARHQTADAAVQSDLMRLFEGVFEVADLDSDGVLSAAELQYAQHLGTLEELQAALQASPSANESLPEFGVAGAFESFLAADDNGDLSVDRHEFERFMSATLSDWGWQEGDVDSSDARAIFGTADVIKDGGLDVREYQFASCLAIDKAASILTAEVMRDIDLNDDGKLDKRELEDAADAGIPARKIQRIDGSEENFSNIVLGSIKESDGMDSVDAAAVKRIWKRLSPSIGCDMT